MSRLKFITEYFNFLKKILLGMFIQRIMLFIDNITCSVAMEIENIAQTC